MRYQITDCAWTPAQSLPGLRGEPAFTPMLGLEVAESLKLKCSLEDLKIRITPTFS